MTTTATIQNTRVEQKAKSLVWSEYLYLLGVVVATLVTVDPLKMNLAGDTIIKHLGLGLSVPAVVLSLVGRRLFLPSGALHPVLDPIKVAWPLLLLAALIVCGSLYARLGLQMQDTFLNVGLYMLVTFAAAAMMLQTEAPDKFLRAYFGILVAAALVMGCYLVVKFRVHQVYHEQIFLVVPMAALFFLGARQSLVRWGGALFFLATSWLSLKFTGYMVGMLTLLYLGAVLWSSTRTRYSVLHRVTVAYWAVLLAALIPLVWLIVTRHGGIDLPTGNTTYRLHTYTAAWNEFTSSPLWGTLFVAQSVHKFTLYHIGIAGNRLPTHSDILDLLANGGILGVGLLVAGFYRVARVAHRMLFETRARHHPWFAYGHTLALMSICAIVTYTFNPILLQPSMAYLVWANLGVLLGLVLRAR